MANKPFKFTPDQNPQRAVFSGMADQLDKLTSRAAHRPPASFKRLPNSLYEFVHTFPFQVDKKPLDFDRHPYLIPIYQAINFDKAVHPDSFDFVLMTAAQVGKSVTSMLALIFAASKFWGDKMGYFLPDREMADIFSSDRFAPMITSNPTLGSLLGESQELGIQGEDRKRVRTLGASTIFFSYMGGKTSTEAIPMGGVFFDEVRRMHQADVERASERTSHADYPLNFKLSTARHPDNDIHAYFTRSTQHVWHSRCGCPEGIVLAERWPECIGERNGEVFYRCPVCDSRIANPQDGWYVARTPESRTVGFHVPQLISPAMTPARIWTKWQTATDRQEFYNSTLGLPYVDPETILVDEAVAYACVDRSLRWQKEGHACFMGVDQRGGENHAVIGALGKDKKLELRHLAILQGEDPFAGLYELMTRFHVECCVMDALPSYNEAVKFAKMFKGRVFLAYYTENVHTIRWSDRDHELKALQRSKADSKFEHHVMLDRYKSLEYMLMQWVDRRIACPDPDGLNQMVRVNGLQRLSQICKGNPETAEQGLFRHLRVLARRRLPVQRRDSATGESIETGEFRMTWENIGLDPHFAHAMNYMVTASQRKPVTNEIWFPTASQPAPVASDPHQSAVQDQLTGRLGHMLHTPPIETCGRCRHFQEATRRCMARNFTTDQTSGACPSHYEARDE